MGATKLIRNKPGPWSDWKTVEMPGVGPVRMRSRTYPDAPEAGVWSAIPPVLDSMFPELGTLRENKSVVDIDLDAENLAELARRL